MRNNYLAFCCRPQPEGARRRAGICGVAAPRRCTAASPASRRLASARPALAPKCKRYSLTGPYFFREVLHVPAITKEVLRQRTTDYRNWVEAFARNHNIPVKWAEKGVRKEDYVLPWLRRMTKRNGYGVYFIFKSMEQGRTFRMRFSAPW